METAGKHEEVVVEEFDVGIGQTEETSTNGNEAEEAFTVVEETTEACSVDKQADKAAEIGDSIVNLESEIGKPAENAVTDFSCLICDFESNWKNGLKIHIARKHDNIEQMDGNNSLNIDEVDEDQKYSETHHYWKTGKLGTIFQSYLDANEIVDKSNLEEEAKAREKEKILEARKHAFGNHFRNYPPWK